MINLCVTVLSISDIDHTQILEQERKKEGKIVISSNELRIRFRNFSSLDPDLKPIKIPIETINAYFA